MQKITTFLMFDGKAEEAMNFYTSLFENSKILSLTRYGPNEAGAEGTVMHAAFSLGGQEFMCIDSNVKHEFTFTPAISLYVNCETEEEIDGLFEKLSHGGQVLMPLDRYPFSEKFAWLSDKFGVSWQLNLSKNQLVHRDLNNPTVVTPSAASGLGPAGLRFLAAKGAARNDKPLLQLRPHVLVPRPPHSAGLGRHNPLRCARGQAAALFRRQ